MLSFRLLKIGVLPLVLAGCGSITGLENAQSDFACSVEMPAQCASMTQVHEGLSRTDKRNVAFSKSDGEKPKRTSSEITERIVLNLDKEGGLKEKPVSPMQPRRQREEILTVWIAPFVDEEGDLHDEQRIHVTVKAASWSPDSLVVPRNDDANILHPLDDQRSVREVRVR